VVIFIKKETQQQKYRSPTFRLLHAKPVQPKKLVVCFKLLQNKEGKLFAQSVKPPKPHALRYQYNLMNIFNIL